MLETDSIVDVKNHDNPEYLPNQDGGGHGAVHVLLQDAPSFDQEILPEERFSNTIREISGRQRSTNL